MSLRSLLAILSLVLAIAFPEKVFAGSQTHAQLGVAARSDELRWNISAPQGSPNILSELSWKRIYSVQCVADAAIGNLEGFHMRLHGAYGPILSGTVYDRDYIYDNRHGCFSDAKCSADHGHLFDVDVALALAYHPCGALWTVIPYAGYSHRDQHLSIGDGSSLMDLFDGNLHTLEITNNRSSYVAHWHAALAGVELLFHPSACYRLSGIFEYHRAFFRGKGHWSLRTDFADDFLHKTSSAHGFVGRLQWDWQLFDSYSLALVGQASYFIGRDGTDRIFVAIDDQVYWVETKLREVIWKSFSIALQVGHTF